MIAHKLQNIIIDKIIIESRSKNKRMIILLLIYLQKWNDINDNNKIITTSF